MKRAYLHPLAAGSPGHLWRSARELGPVDADARPILALAAALSLVITPFRWAESARFGAKIRAMKITQPPVFILSFWRSGTTLLHQLLALDPALAAPETVHLVFPSCSLVSGVFRRVLATQLPAQRALDGVRQGPDLPEEEEMALSLLGSGGLSLGIYFPSRLRRVFARAVAFESVADRETFSRDYLYVLRKLTLLHRGRSLVLKNPPNMGRIPILLELFPDARFIFLRRNKQDTLTSARRWLEDQHKKALQTVSAAQRHADLDFLYDELHDRCEQDRRWIPSGHQVDLDFRWLTSEPIAAIRDVYQGLSLPISDAAIDAMQRYLAPRPPMPLATAANN